MRRVEAGAGKRLHARGDRPVFGMRKQEAGRAEGRIGGGEVAVEGNHEPWQVEAEIDDVVADFRSGAAARLLGGHRFVPDVSLCGLDIEVESESPGVVISQDLAQPGDRHFRPARQLFIDDQAFHELVGLFGDELYEEGMEGFDGLRMDAALEGRSKLGKGLAFETAAALPAGKQIRNGVADHAEFPRHDIGARDVLVLHAVLGPEGYRLVDKAQQFGNLRARFVRCERLGTCDRLLADEQPSLDQARVIVDEEHQAKRRAVADPEETAKLDRHLRGGRGFEPDEMGKEILGKDAHHISAEHLGGERPAQRVIGLIGEEGFGPEGTVTVEAGIAHQVAGVGELADVGLAAGLERCLCAFEEAAAAVGAAPDQRCGRGAAL